MAAEDTLTAPGAAPAALEGAHAGTAPAEHGGGGGLPQFELQYWGGQIVWLLLIFGVLYVLMSRVFIPRLRQVQDTRAETISSAVAEARRVQELIAEIKQAAIRLEQAWPEGADFTEIDGLPDVNLPMERQFWRPTIKTTFGETEIAIATADLEEANWAALFNQRHVDETRLRRNIDILLDQRPQVTLTEVLVTFPVQQGLAEVVTYLAIAAKNAQHTIEPTVREMVELRDETVVPTGIDGEQASRRITLPQIIFRAG